MAVRPACAPRTFTASRTLTLLLIGPAVAIAVAVGLFLSPNGGQLFHSTVTDGGLPVVTTHLTHRAYIDQGPPLLDPIATAVHEVSLDDIASAIEWVK